MVLSHVSELGKRTMKGGLLRVGHGRADRTEGRVNLLDAAGARTPFR